MRLRHRPLLANIIAEGVTFVVAVSMFTVAVVAVAAAAATRSLAFKNLCAFSERRISDKRGAWYDGMSVSSGGSADLWSLMEPPIISRVKNVSIFAVEEEG